MAKSPQSADELRRRVLGWRAAEAREMAARRAEAPLSVGDSLAGADELRALNPGAFSQSDPVREREVAAVRATWAKLRARLPWQSRGKATR